MALIKCKECGGIVSDLATTCPHCGCPVENQQRTVVCPECGQEISEKDMKCPNCGCPSKLSETQKPIHTPVPNNINQEASQHDTKLDIAAIISLGSAVIGIFTYAIIFVPLSLTASIISFFRCKNNPCLHGWTLRVIAAIINIFGIIAIMRLWNL